MDNAVGVLIDISNSSFISPTPIYKTTKKQPLQHNVPTEILVNLSDSYGLSDSDLSEVKVKAEVPSIREKDELNYSQVFSQEQFNDSLIPDCILWDPKMRLDYQGESLSPNLEIKAADNCVSNNIPVATEKPVGINGEKITAMTSKSETSLAITSTPTDDRAPNVDENFKLFKRELSFGSSPTERMRRSVVCSSAGSLAAHDNNFKPNLLQPTILFNQPVKLAKGGISSKPSVPSRRTSTQPNLKKLNHELTNQKGADLSNEQKNKINLKNRISLAPPPRQLTRTSEPVKEVGLQPPTDRSERDMPGKHPLSHPSGGPPPHPRQLGSLPPPGPSEAPPTSSKQKVNGASTAIHPPKLQQRKLSQPLDNSKPLISRSSTPVATAKSSLASNQRDSSQKNRQGNQRDAATLKKAHSGSIGSRLPSLDRKNVSSKSANNSNKKLDVGRHRAQLTAAQQEMKNKNAQQPQQTSKENVGLKKMEKPPVKPVSTKLPPKIIKK